ncbi:hypothetical protein CPC08DRAFT_709156, partial [Agrocybe pediades]
MSLKTDNQYIRFSVNSAVSDVLTLRKMVSDALTQQFGMTFASTHLDVLWLDENGSEFVIRIDKDYATNLATALALRNESPRISLVRESPFLPSLLRVPS